MESLERTIKEKLVARLELEMSADDIADDAPLFGPGGLGLDSVDALEVVAMLRIEFDVDIADGALAREALATIRTMADHVRKHG